MQANDFLEICQRLAGLYAAGKNMHYAAPTYGDHVMADRFIVGDADGFNCFDAIDEIQESLVMFYDGKSLDLNEIFLYPEDFSLDLKEFKDYCKGVEKFAGLFDEFIEEINKMKKDDATSDLMGNLARRAQRASAFLKSMMMKKEGKDGRKSKNVADASPDATDGKVA